MNCPACQNEARKFGKDRYGNQRFQCLTCRKTFSDRPAKVLGTMRLDLDKAAKVLHLLLEGMSIRSASRISGTNRSTIIDLMVKIGDRCEEMLAGRIQDMPVVDVQCDEIWGFVKMKEKTRQDNDVADPTVGDAYCFVAIERSTKMVLAWHLGRRSSEDAHEFARKLSDATTGRFQITTDGFKPYQRAVPTMMPWADFATLVKDYATKDDHHRYSPGEVVAQYKTPCCGNPDPDRICTSHIERKNLTIRMQNRRMTRLTNAHSKKWENHRAAFALQFAFNNFCRVHMTLKMTPAMKAGIEDHPWTIKELIEKTSTLN